MFTMNTFGTLQGQLVRGVQLKHPGDKNSSIENGVYIYKGKLQVIAP